MKYLYYKFFNNPDIVFYILAGFVAFSYLLMILIDALNIFGIQNILVNNLNIPYFWYHYFEIPFLVPLGWFLLGLVLLVFTINAGAAYHKHDKKVFSFWLLISIGLTLMLVEDTGDVRHILRFKLESFFDEGPYGYYGTLWELFYFVVIGSVMLFALLYFRKVYWHHTKTRNYLLTGYLFYFISQVSSFTSTAFQSEGAELWYENAGKFILNRLFVRNELSERIYQMAITEDEWLHFNFMDFVYEESLEFIGAAALLTAGVSFLVYYKQATNKTV
jgi:hypothetical protein